MAEFEITDDTTLFDLISYRFGVDEDQTLTPDQRVKILGELTDLENASANFVKSRDRIAAERMLEQFKAQQKALGDQRAFEQQLQILKFEKDADRAAAAVKAASAVAGRLAVTQKKLEPNRVKIQKAITGAKTLQEQIKELVGDPIMDSTTGISGPNQAQTYANLKQFGIDQGLFTLEEGEVNPTEKLVAALGGSLRGGVYRQLQAMVQASYPEYRQTEVSVDELKSFKNRMDRVAEDPTLQISQADIDKAVAVSRVGVGDPDTAEVQVSEDIQEITRALAKDDSQLAAFEAQRDRLVAELSRGTPEDKVNAAYAKAVANPFFRQWAESNGFSLGTSDGDVLTYEPGSDDGRAIMAYALQAKTNLRLAPRAGRGVEYEGETYIEDRLTAYDISRNKRRLYNSETGETIEIPLDVEIKYLDPLRIPPGQRLQMRNNRRVDERRERRVAGRFGEEMSVEEQRILRKQEATQDKIDADQALLEQRRPLDVGADTLVLKSADMLLLRDKNGRVVTIDGNGRIDEPDPDLVRVYEAYEKDLGSRTELRDLGVLVEANEDGEYSELKARLGIDRISDDLARAQQEQTDIVEERAGLRGKLADTPETTLPTSAEREKLESELGIDKLTRDIRIIDENLEGDFISDRQRAAFEKRRQRLQGKLDKANARLAETETLPDEITKPEPVAIGETLPDPDAPGKPRVVAGKINFSDDFADYEFDTKTQEFSYTSPSSGKRVVVKQDQTEPFMALTKRMMETAPKEPAPPITKTAATAGTAVKPESLLDTTKATGGAVAAQEIEERAKEAGVEPADTALEAVVKLEEAGETGTPAPGKSNYDRLMEVQRALRGARREKKRTARQERVVGDALSRTGRRLNKAEERELSAAERAAKRQSRMAEEVANRPFVRALKRKDKLEIKEDALYDDLNKINEADVAAFNEVRRLRKERDRMLEESKKVKLREPSETGRPKTGTAVGMGPDVGGP